VNETQSKIRRASVAEQWDSFARAVLPIGTPPDQRREMRRAFYAGCEGLLSLFVNSLSPDPSATEEDVAIMYDVYAELIEFAAMVKAGRA
jgi:hypothetical protein